MNDLLLETPVQRLRGPASDIAHRRCKQPIGTQQLGASRLRIRRVHFNGPRLVARGRIRGGEKALATCEWLRAIWPYDQSAYEGDDDADADPLGC